MQKQLSITLRVVVVTAVWLGILQEVALAVDGVVLITQARAFAGNVTSGDAPGFPVTISGSGSYRLASNLTVPDAATTAIEITADNVTIDLNGFSIIGTTVCSGSGSNITCSPTSFSQGVRSIGGNNITVMNGSVLGMGGAGILLSGSNTRVENVHTSNNGGDGIEAGFSCIVSSSTARFNGGDGIETGDDCTISRNSSVNNAESGISTGIACTVKNNTVSENSEGILGRGGVTIIGNSAFNNTGVGLLLNPVAGYGSNVLSFNNGGNTNAQVSGGIEIGTNVCGANTTCP